MKGSFHGRTVAFRLLGANYGAEISDDVGDISRNGFRGTLVFVESVPSSTKYKRKYGVGGVEHIRSFLSA